MPSSELASAQPLTAKLKAEARRIGFDLCGICPVVSPPGFQRFGEWLAAGYDGEMRYLPERAAAYEHPRHVLDGARSVIMLAVNYRTKEPTSTKPGQGRVSRYAWGGDYHDVLRGRLNELADWLRRRVPTASVRGVVDTAPLLEREFAQLAGLGWIGKNTLLLNKQLGSWFFLAALLTDVELEYDEPFTADHCGTCRACLDACPTQAFVDAYVLDARRCISYLTIELRESIPTELRNGMGEWLFGCDVCQDVCPWNHRAPVTDEPAFQPADDANPRELAALFDLDDAAFRERFRHTPLWRAKRRGLLRNAAIVLGNRPHPSAISALMKGLNDDEPLVRGACAWALGHFASHEAHTALEKRLAVETDSNVRSEIAAAVWYCYNTVNNQQTLLEDHLMVTITADTAVQSLLGGIRDEATIVDESGRVLGYFKPKRDEELEKLYKEARKHFDPEEVKRRKASGERGVTTAELLAYLRSLAPEN